MNFNVGRFITHFVYLLVVTRAAAGFVNEGLFQDLAGVPHNADTGLTTPQIIERHGYPVESHEVETEDGYLLTIHRIPAGIAETDNDGDRKEVVFLQHGLFCSSAVWVCMGPEKSLAFRLADAGFDVWLGNARGNEFSRRHVNLNPDNYFEIPNFWDFSWDEMGYYDLPAEIDYILEKTGRQNLSYVGHSMGTTMFFVMAATRPEYNDKIKVMHALAPVIFMQRAKSPLRLLAPFLENSEWLSTAVGLHEFLPKSEFLSLMGRAACNDKAITQQLCSNALFLVSGYDSDQLNTMTIPVIANHIPAGVSTKTVIHYAQRANSRGFLRFDHQLLKNLHKYGQNSPPTYDLAAVTAPIVLHYGSNDWLANVKDVDKLSRKLTNLAGKHLVPYENFNHMDFLFAIDVNRLLYDDLIEMLKN